MEKISGTSIERLTIRVYGLLIREGALLLSRENIKGRHYTKFPGGGLQLGEGIVDCLKREFMEEVNLRIEAEAPFFTTEDCVASAFDANVQVISLYYRVRALEPIARFPSSYSDAQLTEKDDQQLFWKALPELKADDFELPLDRSVVELLLREITA